MSSAIGEIDGASICTIRFHERRLKPLERFNELLLLFFVQSAHPNHFMLANERAEPISDLPARVCQLYQYHAPQPGKIIVVYTPGGGHKFYEEFGPISRMGPPDPKVLGPIFTKYDMSLLGPPLTPD